MELCVYDVVRSVDGGHTLDSELQPEMRHVPPLSELTSRLDVRLRFVFDTLYASAFRNRDDVDPETMARVEQLFESLVRWLDRLAEHSRLGRKAPISPHEASLQIRLQNSLENALAALRSFDERSFRRSSSFHSFDKSHAEPVFACMLALGDVSWRIGEEVARFDRTIHMRIYDKLLSIPPLPEPLVA